MDSNNIMPYEFCWRVDNQGNPYSVSMTETIVVSPIYLNAVLEEIPDTYHRVIVKQGETILNEVMSRDGLQGSKFYVDYNEGIICFGGDLANKTLTLSYYGRGYKRISASRVVGLEVIATPTNEATTQELNECYEARYNEMATRVQVLEKQIDFLVEELEKLIK